MLALACDRRVGVEGAFRLGLNETALGLVMPTWAMVIAQGAIRPDRLTEVMLVGRLFSPSDAAAVGIVDAVVGADELDRAVTTATTAVADLPTSVYGATKWRLRGEAFERATARVEREMGASFAIEA